VAWGGNWFFLCTDPVEGFGLRVDTRELEALTGFAWRVKEALAAAGVTGTGGAEIDHVELFAPGADGADARSFVLCPGKAYDRSPCGTGTSAKLACLAADGKLGEGETWVQQGILGSVFEGTYRAGGRGVLPRITGRAWITGRAEILIEADDPFAWGIRGTL